MYKSSTERLGVPPTPNQFRFNPHRDPSQDPESPTLVPRITPSTTQPPAAPTKWSTMQIALNDEWWILTDDSGAKQFKIKIEGSDAFFWDEITSSLFANVRRDPQNGDITLYWRGDLDDFKPVIAMSSFLFFLDLEMYDPCPPQVSASDWRSTATPS